jgi:hypothetical protein
VRRDRAGLAYRSVSLPGDPLDIAGDEFSEGHEDLDSSLQKQFRRFRQFLAHLLMNSPLIHRGFIGLHYFAG